MHKKTRRRTASACVIGFIACAIIGVGGYFIQGREVSHFHFSAIQGSSSSPNINPIFFMVGQYETVGQGFYVGKKINISALVYLRNDDEFQFVEKWPHFVIINNSETLENSKKDLSHEIAHHDMNTAFTVQSGLLQTSNFDDTNHIFEMHGDVVFTKEGVLSFGQPLSYIFKSYNISENPEDEQNINIGPSAEGDQIESNRVIKMLAWVTLGLGILTLRFTITDGE
jgi:hypothetical protein